VDNLNHSWFGAVRLTVAIGIAYFFVARLGLALRSQVGVAIFWPAAGIATGALIALGRPARLPVAIAVASASIASSLSVDRNPWLAITFGVLDMGEVLLPAWIINRWFGEVFKLEEVRQVLGFLVASAIGAAVTAAAAAIAISFAEPAAIPFNVWRLWFASCSLGLITVAPLLIGLGDALREPPPRRELIEGTMALVTLAALSAFLISLPQGPWATALPVALAFPVLLWVAVRCRPVFAAVAMFVVTLTVVWSTTFNMGHFGDASIPLADRILAAQTHVLVGTLLSLVLAALFAERRRNETTLKMSNERLQLAFEREAQLALAGKMGRVGGFTFDIGSGAMQVSPGYAAIHGLPEGTSETSRADWRTRVHPDDQARLDANLQRDVDARCSEHDCEYRIICSTGEMRWIEARSFISYDREGTVLRIIGVNIDITERKQAEKQRDTLNAELDHRVKNVLATVGAIIFQTQNANATLEGFVASVDRRIKSLASTHELLSRAHWHGVSLQEIIQREFAPYTAAKSNISGPRITLRPEAAQVMAMVLHELTTNAAKYGAFSNHAGRVSVRWFWLPNGILHQRLAIEWQETDGPPVSAPSASGYGTCIIREVLPYELGGKVDLSFAPGGVQCRLEIPAEWVSSGQDAEHRTQTFLH
jgi:PAS domain S-box-containing protein